MYYLHCLFDYRANPPKPLCAISLNDETNDVQFYQLYLPKTKFSLHDVFQNLSKIKKILDKEDVVLSDFYSYIKAFKLDINRIYEVWDVGQINTTLPQNMEDAQKQLLVQLNLIKNHPIEEWQQIFANSQLVYYFLESQGCYYNGYKKNPRYGFTYSGRSKCLEYNIQGTNSEDTIEHCDHNMDIFVHFDWIAADFRVASLVSKDKQLSDSFKKSDPYTALHEAIDLEEVTRDQCKLELFRSLYSMNYDSDSLKFYPDFAKWMKTSAEQIEMEGFSKSILGRRFDLSDDRAIRSVFNAQIQGSVAHAMQNTLYRVFKIYPDNLLTEIHDSLILCCNQKDLKLIIEEVSNIMLYPFDGILDENPRFPLKVSIGYDWRKWKFYKEFR